MNPDQHQRLALGLESLGLALDAQQQAKLLAHLDLIVRWNRVYNLTAVRDPSEMLTHHLLDSLSVVNPLLRFAKASGVGGKGEPAARLDILDVGSGAGLPGVPLAIALPPAWPAIHVTCVDTVLKKVSFIRQVAGELALPQLQAVQGRIENLPTLSAQIMTCRAFASLADIVRLTRHHLVPGGVWMLMKGQYPEDEVQALPPDVEVFHVEPLVVPFLDAQRCLMWIRLR